MIEAKLFAIIGAGPGGLAVAKALRDCNIEYIQFEADNDLGGNWYHGVYETVHIISSKKTTEFSDFPMPESYPDFPSGQQMLDYLRSFAEQFRLRENIQFDSDVTAVRPREDDLWDVQINGKDWRIFKGVIVCNGHHWDRRYPQYAGKFDGEVLHAKDYKSPDQLRNKNVLVIGGGNSACDIASEAARVGKTSAISLRRGYWFLPKTIFGTPLTEIWSTSWPLWAQRLILRTLLQITVGDYQKFGLPKPDHKIFEKHPTVNSELLHYLRHGKLAAYPDIKEYRKREIEFVDGQLAQFDLVICATGYNLSFPFLPNNLLKIKNDVVELYGGCTLSNAKNLYIFGTLQPRYGFGPLMTPLAQSLAIMIILQDQMLLPIGLVLKAIGDRPPKTHLIDPIESIRKLKSFKSRCKFLPFVEKILRQRYRNYQTKIAQ